MLGLEQIELRRPFKNARSRRRGLPGVGGVDELEILRDEFEIDQSAGGIFEISARPRLFRGRWRSISTTSAAMVWHRARDRAPCGFLFQRARETGRCPRSARTGERQCSRSRLGLLIALEGVDAGRHRTRAARWSQPHVDGIERAVVGLRGQRADEPLRQTRKILRAIEWSLTI